MTTERKIQNLVMMTAKNGRTHLRKRKKQFYLFEQKIICIFKNKKSALILKVTRGYIGSKITGAERSSQYMKERKLKMDKRSRYYFRGT